MNNQPDKFTDNEQLRQVSYSTGNLLIELVDYIQQEYKTDRVRATFAAGVLIASVPTMIKENEGGREGVQEIINDFDNVYKLFNQN